MSGKGAPREPEVTDLQDLVFEVRSLRRRVEGLERRLADRVPLTGALPLRKVAPLVGFSVGRLQQLMCDPGQRRAFDLDALLFRVGRRWFSTPERIAQWLDARARKDPRLPVGVTSVSQLMDLASGKRVR